jgi:uncharacterized membrane protein (DUF106 family)
VAQNVNIEEGKMVTKWAVHCMYWAFLWSSFQGKFNLEETLVPFNFPNFGTSFSTVLAPFPIFWYFPTNPI